MINVKHLLKVFAAWISIVYAVCFAGLATFNGMQPGFMTRDVLTLGTFISGLLVWNVVGLLAVWLFVALFNRIKK